ncbi:spore coat U domain-containing protein [Massilia atriviolacea]|uniref:Spore coat U domain-containing protein n=1 Tax=Massilia atriviolacea TaxID=2495579 RepID=A0A430HIE4_9BURK|nr:spore coat U domain-containing protein [Massilia atriviolacea]RSZ57270.1 spore coat U domain-containing protein [Massilia atriviolacea]
MRAGRALASLALLACLLWAGQARADTCSVTMSDVVFAGVSPISPADAYASASGNVKCTWNLLTPLPPYILLLPKVLVCINIGIGTNATSASPRTLGNGANRLEYNLYRDATYSPASVAGGSAIAGTSPIAMVLISPNLLIGGTLNAPFTLFGKIPAGPALRAVKTVGNSDTVYSSSFAAAANITYTFFNLVTPACGGGASASFPFNVQATVVNNCNISTAPLHFGSGSFLAGPVRAQGSLSVQCVNNNAFQIALNGGSVAGAVGARQMRRVGGSERINYQLSGSLDGPLWGDGTLGTSMLSGTGTGEVVPMILYGRVPVQASPRPGDYSDTVTATVVF